MSVPSPDLPAPFGPPQVIGPRRGHTLCVWLPIPGYPCAARPVARLELVGGGRVSHSCWPSANEDLATYVAGMEAGEPAVYAIATWGEGGSGLRYGAATPHDASHLQIVVCYVLLHVCGRWTCMLTCRLQSIAARACNQLFHMLHKRVCCTLHIRAVTNATVHTCSTNTRATACKHIHMQHKHTAYIHTYSHTVTHSLPALTWVFMCPFPRVHMCAGTPTDGIVSSQLAAGRTRGACRRFRGAGALIHDPHLRWWA